MMPEHLIYLDHNASTPIAPEVREAMLPLLEQPYGNPSSTHWAGRPAAAQLFAARGQVASLLSANPDEIVFTSGGSESNNMAIAGVVGPRLAAGQPTHLICSAVEHPSVRRTCDHFVDQGASLSVLPVDAHGLVSSEALRHALRADTALVSVMHANNEVGTIQPIAELAAICRENGVLLHTDAAQSAGKIDVHANELGAHLITLAGHKLYAPKGIGALYIARGVALQPLIFGAAHEAGRRAGTESVLLASALGAACDLAWRKPYQQSVRALRDQLWQQLQARLGDAVQLLGHPEKRLPNTANIAFVGHIAAELLAAVPRLAASAGAACHAERRDLSEVQRAMAVDERVGLAAVRFSLGRATRQQDIDVAVELLSAAVMRGAASNRS